MEYYIYKLNKELIKKRLVDESLIDETPLKTRPLVFGDFKQIECLNSIKRVSEKAEKLLEMYA